MYETISPIPIDRTCTSCTLSCGLAVGGQGPSNLNDIKLIVISDYPGAYETEFGWPQVPNDWVATQRARKPNLPPPPNSGAFIRKVIADELKLDSYTQVWISNAIKCDPKHGGKDGKPSDRILGLCATAHLKSEFTLIDRAVPNIPVLAAGSWALKALRAVYKDAVPDGGIDSLLRKPNLKAGTHPLVCCYNPATYARSSAHIETSVRVDKRTGSMLIDNVRPLSDLIYTPTHVFLSDLAQLKTYINYD